MISSPKLKILILTVVGFYFVGCETSTNSQIEVFKIGILAPKTGFMSGHGASIEKGAKVAEKMLNSMNGILNQKVEVVILDTQSDPSITADRTKELIEKHKVKLLIGTGTSASTLAAITPITETEIPFIYSLDGECKTCSISSKDIISNNVWGSGFTERMIVKPYLNYLSSKVQEKSKDFKVFFVGGDYVYPRTTNAFAIQVAQDLGFKIVGEEYSATSTKDYTPLFRRIIDAKPDLLIVTNPGASGVTFMRQSLQIELNKSMMIGGFATFDQEAIEAMGKASEGVYVINRYSKNLENVENKKFLEAYSSLYPNDNLFPGPTAAAGAYGAIITAAKAFNLANSNQLNLFQEKMRDLEINLPQGSIKVNGANNIFDQHVYLMQVINQDYQVVEDLGIQTHPLFEGCSVE